MDTHAQVQTCADCRRRVLAAALIATPAPGQAVPTVSPFQTKLNGTLAPRTVSTNLAFTAPAGKTLVIECISGECFVLPGQSCVFSVFTEVNGARSGTPLTVATKNVGYLAEMPCGGQAGRSCCMPMGARS